MKYKLINFNTKEEILCDKVTIDGFDCYVSDKKTIINFDWVTQDSKSIWLIQIQQNTDLSKYKKVIVTTNPKIDLPKVVDEVELMAKKETSNIIGYDTCNRLCFALGYNHSQSTHPNSDEDMIEFAKFRFTYETRNSDKRTTKEILDLWKEQKPKVVYYQ